MASVIDTTNVNSTQSVTSQTKNTGSSLDKDAFLQLLVTEMKYQDPLNPSTNTEYMSQLAQFSQLEAMNNLSDNYANSSAFGLVGKYVIEKLARVEVTVDIASEFRYRDPLITKDDLVILISQSGETADTHAALKMSKERGATTLAVVNVKGSTIAREADVVIYTHAGPEISVASTKAYSVQLSIMYLLAFELAYAKGAITEERCKELTAALVSIPDKMQEVLEIKDRCQFIASRLVNSDSLLYIGRGLDYALSMEGSLKLKEISYIHSESYAAGELKHGTISLVTQDMPVVVVATQKDLLEKTISNAVEVKSRGAKVTMICPEDLELDKSIANHLVKLPVIEDVLMPMLAAVPMQYIAYYTAVLKGCNVDQPRNLAKSVTVE